MIDIEMENFLQKLASSTPDYNKIAANAMVSKENKLVLAAICLEKAATLLEDMKCSHQAEIITEVMKAL